MRSQCQSGRLEIRPRRVSPKMARPCQHNKSRCSPCLPTSFFSSLAQQAPSCGERNAVPMARGLAAGRLAAGFGLAGRAAAKPTSAGIEPANTVF
ncbi:hypothetical protein [Pandoravirus japonicus]|uniref:Uncharacterized protein n=1 Tax=Pandoravirus japonicus TaxID=2823154 RepID=A0A811BNC6_9VIRU|nr:hypothetical protein [Pandoravirus japonicus]